MKKSRIAKRQRSHSSIVHLTISLPLELAAFIKKKTNYSGVIASLIGELKVREEGTPAPSMSSEEIEIRQTLKERERLIALYDGEHPSNPIYDIEYAIGRGENPDIAMADERHWIKDWRAYRDEKGVEDPNGYFEMYERHMGEHAEDRLFDLWKDVESKVKAEQEREHEERLKKEVAPGMPFQDAMEKLNVYLKIELDKRVKELMIERDAIKDDGTGAGPYMQRKQITEDIEALERRYENKEVRMKEIVNALGLPYMEVYNKVAPALRKEGYKITEKR